LGGANASLDVSFPLGLGLLPARLLAVIALTLLTLVLLTGFLAGLLTAALVLLLLAGVGIAAARILVLVLIGITIRHKEHPVVKCRCDHWLLCSVRVWT
jgi:hypothetical protein